MKAEELTRSEQLFDEFCNEQKVMFNRLSPIQIKDRKQPDRIIDLQGKTVVVEIKQIEPNEDDKRFHKTLERDGMSEQRRNPDDVAERVRNLIKDGARQIKSYLLDSPPVPAIIVILDNAKNR